MREYATGGATGGEPTAAADAPAGATGGAADERPDGWQVAVEELRGRLADERATVDRLRSELDRERVARQDATRRADEAEAGRMVSDRRVEQLRAAWWRWYATLTCRSFWRLRKLPEVPIELDLDQPALTG